MASLRHHDLVKSRRGSSGGYSLSRSASMITAGTVMRAISGPLLVVGGMPSEYTADGGITGRIPKLWTALEHGLQEVLDGTTLAQLLPGADVQRQS
jgi:Rrf2 family transcriptional regulator, cysteine metabolism repressor